MPEGCGEKGQGGFGGGGGFGHFCLFGGVGVFVCCWGGCCVGFLVSGIVGGGLIMCVGVGCGDVSAVCVVGGRLSMD
ncbi:hypothetical protein RA264_28180, partial [Pseudomonas syringae pv. tagetis]|uniref:hypothetical protein n=1 Tax=Pseudomonas syringae group genomosp. 7 TaxID=251699 RepID=UPI00376F5CF2